MSFCVLTRPSGMEDPYLICMYPGTGTADGLVGDHIILAPPYIADEALIIAIADRTARTVEAFFREKNL